MKNSVAFVLALAAVSQANAQVEFAERNRRVDFNTLSSAPETLQGSWVNRLAENSIDPVSTNWSDQFKFTMTDNGSFAASIQSFYLDVTTSGLGDNARIGFANPIRLFDITDSAVIVPVGVFTISNSSRDFNGVSFGFNGLLDEHTYRLDVSGLTNGDKGQAWYKLTAHAPAVPEPSTYALLALGLGAVGLMRRSRTRRDV